jgi:hypothetical protein
MELKLAACRSMLAADWFSDDAGVQEEVAAGSVLDKLCCRRRN